MKNRYIVKIDSKELFQAPSIQYIAKQIGCTRQHIYKYSTDNKFTYKKIEYEIEDKLN